MKPQSDNTLALWVARLLLKENAPVPSSTLCAQASISAVKLRETIRDSHDILLDYGVSIAVKPKVGYSIEIVDEDCFKKSPLYNSSTVLPESLSEEQIRESRFINRLVCSDGYILVDDVADELSLSRSSALRVLNKIKQMAEPFHLQIVSKPHHGIKLEGKELDIRNFCSDYYIYSSPYYRVNADAQNTPKDFISLEDKEQCTEICRILRNSLPNHIMEHSPIIENDLMVTLITICNRVQIGGIIELPEDESGSVRKLTEYSYAKQIFHEISTFCKSQLPESEVVYFAMKLNSYLEGFKSPCAPQIKAITSYALRRIDEEYKRDFLSDRILLSGLERCLSMTLASRRWNVRIYSPLIHYESSIDHDSLKLAAFTAKVIEQRYGIHFYPEDIAVMLPLFDLALLMQRTTAREIHLGVLDFDDGYLELLRYKLETYPLRNIQCRWELIPLHFIMLPHTDLSRIDFIISYEPHPLSVDIPVVMISPSVTDKDVEEIVHSVLDESCSKSIPFTE